MMNFFDLNFWPVEKPKNKKTILKRREILIEKKLGLTPLEYKHSNYFLKTHLRNTQNITNVKKETQIFFEMNYIFRNNDLDFYLPQIFENTTKEYTGYYMNYTRVRDFFSKIRRLKQD